MLFFSLWVAFICLSIIALPVAATLDKRKLRADFAAAEAEAMSDAEEPVAEVGEVEESPEESMTSLFDVEVDGAEMRQADAVDGLGGDEMVSQFPDFDVAYLTAACPGGAGDVGSSNLTLLKSGVRSCVRKSWLLGRISSYWLVKGDADKAFQFGVQSVLAAGDVTAQDVAGTISFLQPVFAAAKQKDLAAKLETMLPGTDGAVDAKQMKKLVKKMGNRKSKAAVSEAAALLFSKGL
jgi:hypothetical protein